MRRHCDSSIVAIASLAEVSWAQDTARAKPPKMTSEITTLDEITTRLGPEEICLLLFSLTMYSHGMTI